MKSFKIFFHNSHQLTDVSLVRIRVFLWFLGRHAFLVMLILVLMGVLYGEILFYRYVFLANEMPPQSSVTIATFKENVYTSILEEQIIREEAFKGFSQENYPNPFQ